ncbi:unnamed protein product [Paramecium octaurelia]|uniref:Uncharacterized protein n=1 Tax=Paramecium octaurelia TaxID=43137 RepID=A0A8S1SA11_PAROT|nr:unnamed protein product [Paramecium octaurelia]
MRLYLKENQKIVLGIPNNQLFIKTRQIAMPLTELL